MLRFFYVYDGDDVVDTRQTCIIVTPPEVVMHAGQTFCRQVGVAALETDCITLCINANLNQIPLAPWMRSNIWRAAVCVPSRDERQHVFFSTVGFEMRWKKIRK